MEGAVQSQEPDQTVSWSDGDFHAGMLALADADPLFRTRYESSRPWWRHLAYAALEFHDIAIRADPKLWALRLSTEGAKRLIERTFGRPINGMLGALQKLGPSAARRQTYRRLLDCLSQPSRLKYVQHAQVLDSDRIEALWALTEDALSANLVESCSTPYVVEVINYAAGCVRRALPAEHHANAWRSLRTQRDLQGVYRWLLNWLKRVPFPAPPWSGSALLQPIADGRELANMAKAFDNCAMSHIGMLIEGRTALYVWRGTMPAMAQLTRDPFFGWVVGEVSCKGNEIPHDALRDEILGHFRSARFEHRPVNIFRILHIY